MDKKRIMMIAMVLGAVVLLVLKIGPLVMPRSWRSRRMARRTGQPTAEERAAESPQEPEAPQETETAPEDPGTGAADAADYGAPVEISPAFLDRAIEKIRALKAAPSYEGFPEKDGLITPFRLLAAKDESGEDKKPPLDILVSGILFDRERPLAIINGGVYSEGDEFEGMEIINIWRNSVVFSGEEDEFNVTLGERIGG